MKLRSVSAQVGNVVWHKNIKDVHDSAFNIVEIHLGEKVYNVVVLIEHEIYKVLNQVVKRKNESS